VLGLIDVKAGDAGSILTHKQRSKDAKKGKREIA
jgi:hypothetical protein